MRIFLVGEGPTDIGELAVEYPYRDGREGFLQPLIRTMIGGPCEFDGTAIKLLGKKTVKTKPTARKRKADHAMLVAHAMESELLVYSIDSDHHFEERRSDLQTRFQDGPVPFAIAMPKESIEAWALADSNAVAAAGGAPPPNHPEELWGHSHQPDSSHPKSVLRRLFNGTLERDTYAQIAANARPSELCSRCPVSFRPFADEVSAVSGTLPCSP
jgi:hypothetical protein